jgi:hypothetical protein
LFLTVLAFHTGTRSYGTVISYWNSGGGAKFYLAIEMERRAKLLPLSPPFQNGIGGKKSQDKKRENQQAGTEVLRQSPHC